MAAPADPAVPPAPARRSNARGWFAVVAWHAALGAINWGTLYAVGRATFGPGRGEYWITAHVTDAWLRHWPWIGPLQLALAFLCGRRGALRGWSVLVACVACYMVPVIVECDREPTAHNLIPFELAFFAFACLPLFAGVELRRYLARRALSRSPS